MFMGLGRQRFEFFGMYRIWQFL